MKRNYSLMTIVLLALFIGFVSCSKDDDELPLKLNETSITIYSDQTFELKAISGDKNNITWASENQFVATVSTSGIVKAEHIGKTKIRANDVICEVTVKPKYNLYTEPYMNWGASKTEVKSKCGTPYSEDVTSLIYTSSSSLNPLTLYSFENGKLTSAASLISTSYSSQLVDFLGERYSIIGADSNEKVFAIFINGVDKKSSNTMLGLSLYNLSYIMVLYTQYSYSSLRSSSDFNTSDEMKLKIEKLIKENDNLTKN